MKLNFLQKRNFGFALTLMAMLISACKVEPEVVDIKPSKLEVKSLQGNYVGVGNTIKLKAVITPVDVTNKEIIWTSKNTEYATVDENGYVLGIKASEEPITITAQTVVGKIKKSIKINVVDRYVKLRDFSISCSKTEINAGSAVRVNIVFIPEDAVDKTIVWTSSNNDKVSVSEDGVVMAIAPTQEGSPVTVTAYSPVTGSSETIEFTVAPYAGPENVSDPVFDPVPSKDDYAEYAAKFPTKRGIGYNNLNQDQIKLLAAGNVTWAYNWGKTTEGEAASCIGGNGKELYYMPMLWGNPDDEAIKIVDDYLKASPGVKYLLGINEPNMHWNEGGCWTVPKKAAEAWPKLEALAEKYDLYLVGPAMTYSGAPLEDGKVYGKPETWLDAFVLEYKRLYNKKPRMDFIALHSYMAWPDSVVKGYCKVYADYYKNYNYRHDNVHPDLKDKDMKVLLTEFCAWWNEGQAIDFEWQCQKASQKIEAMDQADYMEAYAWFKADHAINTRPWNSLFDGEITGYDGEGNPNKWNYFNKLNKLGLIYTYMSNHNTYKWFKPGEAVTAVNYITSSNYQSDANDPYSTPLVFDVSDDADSKEKAPLIIGRLSSKDFLNYQIEVEEEGIYEIRLRVKTNAEKKFAINNSEVILPSTNGEWNYLAVQFPLEEGQQVLKISGKDNKACSFAWFDFVKK